MLGSAWPAAGRAAWWGWPLVFSSNFHIKKNKEKKTYKNKNPTSPSCVLCPQFISLSWAHRTPVTLEEPSAPPPTPSVGVEATPCQGLPGIGTSREKPGQQHVAPCRLAWGRPCCLTLALCPPPAPWGQRKIDRGSGLPGRELTRHVCPRQGWSGPGLGPRLAGAGLPCWGGQGDRVHRAAGRPGRACCSCPRMAARATGPPKAGVPFPPGEFAQISASPFSETLPRSGPPNTRSRPTGQVHPGQMPEGGVRKALGGAPS